MKELKHPAKSLYQNELKVEDQIIAPEEDYHMGTGANRQLHRRISQKSQCSYNTTAPHTSQNKSTSTEKQLVPNNQILKWMKKPKITRTLNHYFSPKNNHPPSLVSSKNTGGAQWDNPLDQKGEILI